MGKTFDKAVKDLQEEMLDIVDKSQMPASVVILICESIITIARKMLVLEVPKEKIEGEVKND